MDQRIKSRVKEQMEKIIGERLAQQETCPVTGRPMAEVQAEREAAGA